MNERTRTLLGALAGHALFWGWNGLFLLLLWVGFGPTILLGMVVATINGFVPWHVTAFALCLVSLPAAFVGLGLWKLRTDPGRLLSMFYGVQAPLMLLCVARLFMVQALTPATGLFLVVVAVGCLGLLRTLLSGFEERAPAAQVGRQVAQTTFLASGLWWGVVFGLYAVPIALAIATELPSALAGILADIARGASFGQLKELPLILLGLGFAAATVAALALFPVAMLGISLRSFWLVTRSSVARLGQGATAALSVGTLATLVVGFAVASRQPQHRAFEVLEGATSDAARRDALMAEELVRAGLINARLAEVRHLDADPEGRDLGLLWSKFVGEAVAQLPSAVWRAAMVPFLYQDVSDVEDSWTGPHDRALAEAAYADFFDAPMSRAERDVLLRATRQTWSWEAAQASLLEIGDRKVHLDRQAVTVDVRGDHAALAIHDVYRGQTWADEEIWISFSLADGAVPTGLWLGHEDDRSKAFRFVVAPRGAAQEIYEREVQRRVDPALLEQVGPRQFRLRAYPVPSREGDPMDVWTMGDEGPELHLWLDLVTPLDADGRVPMPVVTEVRNLWWDAETERTLDGAAVRSEDWIPSSDARGTAPAAHTVEIAGMVAHAEPARPTPTRLGRVGVLVDGTRSMDAHREAVAGSLRALRASADEVVVFCVVEQAVRRCDDFDPADALFWGAVSLEQRLVEVTPLAASLDALIVLTDAGSYELAAEAEAAGLPDVTPPRLWLVHHGGMPVAYADWTADRLQRTGGGAVGSVEELVGAWSDPAIVGGWRWTFEAPDTVASPRSDDPFARLAARQLVAELDRAKTLGLVGLDALHAVAVGQEIVTPYSSMIVLVEQRQLDALAEASEGDDRFDREVTSGEQDVVSAVPEPGTWLLLALGGGALAASRRRRRGPPSPGSEDEAQDDPRSTPPRAISPRG